MKRKLFAGLFAIVMGSMVLMTSCGNNGSSGSGTPQQSAEAAQPQYLSKEDLKADIEAGGSGYIILDVRKSADYDEQHIKGAYSADVDPSISDNDNDTSTANLKAAVNEATGSDTGNSDSKYVLVCYSGKKYAEAATGLLVDMGVPAGNIYTLEGGNNGFKEAGDDYTSLME